ncbi:unnamed protein product, partial [Meganyctiphanes norvegica]
CPMPHKKCQRGRGQCKPNCEATEYFDKRASEDECGGSSTGCQCCIFGACKTPNQMCKGQNGNRKGTCKSNCHRNEEPVGICEGHGGQCKCCAQKQCLEAVGTSCPGNGLCKPKCDSAETQAGSCPGPQCVCCVT